MPLRAVPCSAVPFMVMARRSVPLRAVLCRSALSRVVPCRLWLWRAAPCCAVSVFAQRAAVSRYKRTGGGRRDALRWPPCPAPRCCCCCCCVSGPPSRPGRGCREASPACWPGPTPPRPASACPSTTARMAKLSPTEPACSIHGKAYRYLHCTSMLMLNPR